MAGIPDPAAELARLRACEAALRRVMQWYLMDTSTDGCLSADIFDEATAALSK